MRNFQQDDLAILQDWHDKMVALDNTYDKYSKLIDIESDLMDSVFRLTDHYTRVVAYSLQVDEEWLFWWHCECEFGKRPMGARVGEKEFVCSSLDDLVAILSEDV